MGWKEPTPQKFGLQCIVCEVRAQPCPSGSVVAACRRQGLKTGVFVVPGFSPALAYVSAVYLPRRLSSFFPRMALALLRNDCDVRDRMYLHPFRVKRVLYQRAHNANMRTDSGKT